MTRSAAAYDSSLGEGGRDDASGSRGPTRHPGTLWPRRRAAPPRACAMTSHVRMRHDVRPAIRARRALGLFLSASASLRQHGAGECGRGGRCPGNRGGRGAALCRGGADCSGAAVRMTVRLPLPSCGAEGRGVAGRTAPLWCGANAGVVAVSFLAKR